MRYSEAFIPTLKENPADAEAISHKLMVRAGLIRKLTAGAYSYLPLGLKVLKNVEKIVRDEMDKAGAQEILMPALQSADLWHETGRYDVLGDELVKFKDRTGREMVIGPTHEEVVTDIARNELHSYKDLPKTVYQIQTKLRDEPRPRFGIVRSKEFIMKDAYSFDKDEKGLDKSYKKMFDTYHAIFRRCGLDTIAVEADTGFMGGSESAEFMLLSESGEDIVAMCDGCGYKSSLAMAGCLLLKKQEATSNKQLATIKEVDTPGVTTIEKVSELLKCKPQNMIKTLIYIADKKPIAVLVRGDHDVNEAKLQSCLKAKELFLADDNAIQKATGGPLGFSGPCGLKGVRFVIDHAVLGITNGVTGANKKDKHFVNVVPGRDFEVKETADVRYITDEDTCPKCKKKISLKRAMEVGHVFKLGTKYSDSMKAKFLDSDGKEKSFIMGCYGIGVNRIIAAAIEQSNDKDGIIWPISIAPYKVIILSLNKEDKDVAKASEKIYEDLCKEGIETLLDDRDISPGMKFKDADLIGIPLQVIIGPKKIKDSKLELKIRATNKNEDLPPQKALSAVKKYLT
ncbi:MAG: proline--tRNA ligase [Candidatus Omnitrophica bacterium]|nr:proline--tRNA ligase [Candidatus Omnitrophota bacterium]